MKQTFGQILRQCRQAKSLSQRDLAVKVGVDFTYISKMENDRQPPPAAETIAKLAQILECPEDLLLSSAGKLNENVKEIITSSPEAMKFLNELTEMRLTSAEWDQLRLNLKNLR